MSAQLKANHPAPSVDHKKLEEWFQVSNQLTALAEREKKLRIELFEAGFPDPKRGTNRLSIGHGKDLKADHRINYKIDVAALKRDSERIPADTLAKVIAFKPYVREGAWNGLSAKERRTFAAIITETPGTPALEIVNVKTRG